MVYVNNLIRYSPVDVIDRTDENTPYKMKLFKFEVFKRPYFFGLLGKKRWVSVGDWATVEFGKQYSFKVLKYDGVF